MQKGLSISIDSPSGGGSGIYLGNMRPHLSQTGSFRHVEKRKGDPKVDHPLKKSWVEKLKMKTDGLTTYFYYRHSGPNSLI